MVPSVDPLRSDPRQEPHVEDDGFTAFVPLDVEYKEPMPPPEQLIFSSTRNNANFLQSIHSRRCLCQGDHWRDVVIVCLIRTYMEQMRIYRSKLPASSSVILTDLLSKSYQCGDSHRTLNVLAIYWDCHESMDIITCHHRPAADQLVARGLFPCAPYRPSLAVSLEMLEFASQLFVCMALNNRAFAAATKVVLAANGFSFRVHDSLRHRFANALIHYQLLIQEVDAEVQHLAHVTLRSVNSEMDLDDDALDALRLDESTPLKSRKYINAQHTTSIPKEAPLADSSPAPLPSLSGTPSEYL